MAEAVRVMEPPKSIESSVLAKKERSPDLMKRMSDLAERISKRAFEFFENNGRTFGREWDDWFKAESEILRPIYLNVQQSEKEITVKAEVPGFAAGDLQVTLEGNRLTISGKRNTKEEKTEKQIVYREQSSDEIMRVIELPAAVDAEKTNATLKDGMLELVMPKLAPARKVSVEAKAG